MIVDVKSKYNYLRDNKVRNKLEEFFEAYAEFTATTDKVPSESAIDYYFLNLTSEAGEVAGVYAKYLRDGGDYEQFQDKLVKEIGDLMWSVSRICDVYGLYFPDIVLENAMKLTDRVNRNVINGSGDDR